MDGLHYFLIVEKYPPMGMKAARFRFIHCSSGEESKAGMN